MTVSMKNETFRISQCVRTALEKLLEFTQKRRSFIESLRRSAETLRFRGFFSSFFLLRRRRDATFAKTRNKRIKNPKSSRSPAMDVRSFNCACDLRIRVCSPTTSKETDLNITARPRPPRRPIAYKIFNRQLTGTETSYERDGELLKSMIRSGTYYDDVGRRTPPVTS